MVIDYINQLLHKKFLLFSLPIAFNNGISSFFFFFFFFLLSLIISPPCSIKYSTKSLFLFLNALSNGVSPSSFSLFMSAPYLVFISI